MADYKVTMRPGNVFNTSANTANQVAATIPTDEIGDNVAFSVTAHVRAVATDDFDEAFDHAAVGTFLREGATLTQVGSTRSLYTANDTNGSRSFNFNVDGDDIQVRVVPNDATPLTWSIDLDVNVMSAYEANSGWTH